MKKLFLLAVIAISVTFTANAQKLGFGVELGGNLSNIYGETTILGNTAKETSDFKLGYQVGAFVDYSITENLFAKAHLLFFTKGGKDVVELGSMKTTTSSNPMYISLPVVVGFGFDLGGIKPFVNAGVYAAYAIGGKTTTNVKGSPLGVADGETSLDFFDKNTDKFDFGARFGAGLEFNQKFIVELNYDLGLLDYASSDNAVMKNNALSLTLGYKF